MSEAVRRPGFLGCPEASCVRGQARGSGWTSPLASHKCAVGTVTPALPTTATPFPGEPDGAEANHWWSQKGGLGGHRASPGRRQQAPCIGWVGFLWGLGGGSPRHDMSCKGETGVEAPLISPPFLSLMASPGRLLLPHVTWRPDLPAGVGQVAEAIARTPRAALWLLSQGSPAIQLVTHVGICVQPLSSPHQRERLCPD